MPGPTGVTHPVGPGSSGFPWMEPDRLGVARIAHPGDTLLPSG